MIQQSTSPQVSPRQITLPGGATITPFPLPPAGFKPLKARDAELRQFGYPRRPKGNPEALNRWEKLMKSPKQFVEPEFQVTNRRRPAPPLRRMTGEDAHINFNWSGAVVGPPDKTTFESVTGHWVIPEVRTGSHEGQRSASFWVGIDGFNGNAPFMVQAGVDCSVSDGNRSCFAWWEWIPEAAVAITNLPVRAGEEMLVILTVLSNVSVHVFMQNVSTEQTASFQVSAPAGAALVGNAAEWIVERPALGLNGTLTQLADYGEMKFLRCEALAHAGITGLTNKVTLSEKSAVGPAIPSVNGMVFLGWRGEDNHLNVGLLDNQRQTFLSKLVSRERTSHSPALCLHNGSLFVAWKGEGNDKLNIGIVGQSGNTVSELTFRQTLAFQSSTSPALASFGNLLFLAWRDNKDRLNLSASSDNGLTFQAPVVSMQKSPKSPALCVHKTSPILPDATLFIAWKGDGNDNLNVAPVTQAADGSITGVGVPVILSDTSPVGPSLASLNGRLFLAWRGNHNDLLNVMASDDNGQTFGHKFTSTEKSPETPCLGVSNATVFIGWKGDGNDKLNTAIVQEADDTLQNVDLTGAENITMLNDNSSVISVGVAQAPDTVDCTYMGLADKLTLSETSPVGPALVSFQGLLLLGWRGEDDHLNLKLSDDNGGSFKNKFRSKQKSSQSPALCVHNGDLFIGWKGSGNNKLNVSTAGVNSETIMEFSPPVFPDSSPANPALASFNGLLFLASRDDNNHIKLSLSDDNGQSFKNTFTSVQKSPKAPAICAHNGNLFLAWKGDGNDNLNVATVPVNGETIGELTDVLTLGDTSPSGPALASLNGVLFIAWRGVHNNQVNVMLSRDNGVTFGDKFVSNEKTSDSPALAVHNGTLFAAWKGNSNDDLNVAQVRLA